MILIVDDNADTAEIVARLLRRAGLKANLVASAGDALACLRDAAGPSALPGLIILDVDMPDMDGIACLRAIRSERAWDDVPVVMYTADSTLERMREALSLGAAGYVVKGVTCWDDFLTTIHQHRRCHVRDGA